MLEQSFGLILLYAVGIVLFCAAIERLIFGRRK